MANGEKGREQADEATHARDAARSGERAGPVLESEGELSDAQLDAVAGGAGSLSLASGDSGGTRRGGFEVHGFINTDG